MTSIISSVDIKSESTVELIHRGVIDVCMQSTSVIIAAELLKHSTVIPSH